MDKKKLQQLFGGAAFIVWFFVAFILNFAPLFILQLGMLVSAVLIILMTVVPFANTIVTAAIWIWALIVAINGPQDTFTVIYYVLFAVQMMWFIPASISTAAMFAMGIKGKIR